MKTVVIAGGCGFIGHKIANLFINNDFMVIIIDNYFERVLDKRTQKKYLSRMDFLVGAKIVNCNICNRAKVSNLFERYKPELVVHLANCPNAKAVNANPANYTDEMIGGTMNLLEAARLKGVERFVYVSSSMVYGDFLATTIAEDHPVNPVEFYGT